MSLNTITILWIAWFFPLIVDANPSELTWSWDKVNFVKCTNFDLDTMKHTWEAYFTIQGKDVEIIVDRQLSDGREEESVVQMKANLVFNKDPLGKATGMTLRSSQHSQTAGYMHVIALAAAPEKYGTNVISRAGAGVLSYWKLGRKTDIDFSSCVLERDTSRK